MHSTVRKSDKHIIAGIMRIDCVYVDACTECHAVSDLFLHIVGIQNVINSELIINADICIVVRHAD